MTQATPFFFGGERRLFGWLHAPTGPRREGAVLIVPPLGHEYMCSHRANRWLAEKLAGDGFFVLRFDLQGTGDSGPAPREISKVPAWRASINLAADELRAQSGAPSISIVGVRFGATLATQVAEERGDIDSLVAVAPVSGGRSYIRQTRILGANAAIRPEDVAHEDGTIEAAGFEFDPATAGEISETTIELRGAPAKCALVVERDDLPDRRFVEALEKTGVHTDSIVCNNYSDFMRSPIHSSLPIVALEQVLTWLGDRYPMSSQSGPAFAGAQNAPYWAATCDEPVQFGELFGVLTMSSPPASEAKGVLLLNTGGDHHVGPHALYTDLARTLAASGNSVLRFDLRGIGDSGAIPENARVDAYPATALADIESAIEYLRDKRAYRDVIVAGVCSGGYYSVHVATRMPIAGMVAVNPPLYWQPGDAVDDDPYAGVEVTRRARRSMIKPAKWVKLLRGDVNLFEHARNFAMAARAGLRGLLDRAYGGRKWRSRTTGLFPADVEVSLIYSAGDPGLKFFQNAFGRRKRELRRRPNFKLDVVRGADHTFMGRSWQRTLVALMSARIEEQRARRAAI